MQRRIERIIENCDGDILDIGCLQHGLEYTKNDDWVHRILCEHFKNVVGIDILDDVLELRAQGYEVHVADAENFDLRRKFDTIVAGNIIEHFSNQGLFLECMKKHLKSGGKLVLTTWNMFWIEYWVRKFSGKLDIHEGHTAWYDMVVLKQLVTRHGFTVKKEEFVVEEEKYKPKTVFGFFWHGLLMPILRKVLPKEMLCDRILVVLLANEQESEMVT